MATILRRRTWMAVAAAFILVVTTLVATTFKGGAANASSVSDVIEYVQTTGNNGTYIQYIPGNGTAPTNESVTSGGGCATPSPSGVPLLQFSASYYASGYGGAATPAVVGAYKSRTGVCQITPYWGIEQFEALRFSVGTNALVKGRLFSSASIDLVGNDKSGVVTQGQLVETLAGNVVGTEPFSSKLPQGTTFVANTGIIASGFDQVAVETLSPSTGSVSVVGPTSTFTFGGAHVTVTKTAVIKNADGTAAGPNYSSVGQVVTYTVTATNDGYEALTNFSVTDVPTPDGFSCSPTGSTLAVGASVVCTGTHTITQADLDSGLLSDTATASGTGAAGQLVTVTASASASVSATQSSQLTLTKTDNLHTYNALGQIVTYTITATNSGNVTLTNVQVTDAPVLAGFNCSGGPTLAPGGVVTCTGTHTVTLDDFYGAGTFSDTATVNGTGPQGQPVSNTASDMVSAERYQLCPGQTITSTANGTSTSGDVTASLTLEDLTGSSCKDYTYFQANTNDFVTSPDDGKSIIFDSQQVAGDKISASFDWGLVPACRPDDGGTGSTPICPATKVSFDNGVTYQVQTYCDPTAPPASPSWCTTSKNFSDVVIDGTTYTHITETWLGTGDPRVSK